MILNKDFKEFIVSLNDRDVRYLVIGGYAVNLHGYPRYTKDIDFWVEPVDTNIQKLVSAINDFGFSSMGLKKDDFKNPDDIIQLGFEPNRIDLLTAIEGVQFDACYVQKSQIVIDNINLDFLSLQDLIKVKRATGRSQDIADADQLEKISDKE